MDTITLDFSDASFDIDQDNTFIIEDDGLQYFMGDDSGNAVPATMSNTGVSAEFKDDGDDVINTIGAATLVHPGSIGEIFEFEFEPAETEGDPGTYTVRSDAGATGILSFQMSESLAPDLMNGELMQLTSTVVSGTGTAFAPLSVKGGTAEAPTDLGMLGYNEAGEWVFNPHGSDPSDPSGQVKGTWSYVETHLTTLEATDIGPDPIGSFDPAAALADVGSGGAASADEVVYLGDGGSNESDDDFTMIIASGDTTGRIGTASNDRLIFQENGEYGGVFKGGAGFDTLVFDFETDKSADGVTVDLMSGTVVFQNSSGAMSSVSVANYDAGAGKLDFDFERIELNGNDDLVIVGESVGQESSDLGMSNGRGGDPVVTGLFQIALGGGNDDVYVDDISSGIMLDLGHTAERADGNIHYNDVTIADGEDGEGVTTVTAETTFHSGSSETDVIMGETGDGTSAVVDYIDYSGADGYNWVTNKSEQGVVVKFGNNMNNDDGYELDRFDASSSDSDSNVIDLRYENNITIADGEDAVGGGMYGEDWSVIRSDNGDGVGVGIEAEGVDYLLVGDANDTDVLVNNMHLYGEDAGILDQAVVDDHQGGYDVLTSAYLSSFEEITRGTPGSLSASELDSDSDLQIKYTGDAGDFVDRDDHITRNASDMHVAQADVVVTSPPLGQALWEKNTAGKGDFYVEIAGTKVNVYFDELDSAWKVDSTAFGVANDVTVDTGEDYSDIENRVIAATGDDGFSIGGEDLVDQDIYLNATETDILALLEDGSLSEVTREAAHDFAFYTKIDGVNVAVDYNYGSWSLSSDEVLVRTAENTLDADGEISVGSVGVDFVDMGSGIAMGNAGSDVYTVGNGDTGIINELGEVTIDDDLGLNGEDFTEVGDTVQFEAVTSVGDLTFTRTKILGEKAGNTLKIDDGGSSVELFDQYNDFLDFRRTEFLVLDDGASKGEIFELYTNEENNLAWENEIYVANDDTDGTLTVDVGGVDHVFLGDGADTVQVSLEDILGAEGTVHVHGIGSGDTLDITTMSETGPLADLAAEIEAGYAAAGTVTDASITFNAREDSVTVDLDGTVTEYSTEDYPTMGYPGLEIPDDNAALPDPFADGLS